MFGRLNKLFGANLEKTRLEEEISLSGKGLFADYDHSVFKIVMGGKELHLYPEPSLVPGLPNSTDLLLIDPETHFDTIHGFKRISPKKKVILGREDPEQVLLFRYPNKVAMRHLSIEFKGDGVLFKDLATDTGSSIAPIVDETVKNRLLSNRKSAVEKIRAMYGGPLKALYPAEALSSLHEVNKILLT